MDWQRAEAAFAKALALKRNRDNLFSYGNFLMRAGRTSDARRNYSESDTVERVALGPSRLRMNVELSERRFAEARQIAARLSEGLRLQANILIALNDGSADDLRAAISALPQDDPSVIALYSALVRELNSPDAVLARLRAVHADTETQWPSKYHDIALLAAYFGDPEFALEVFSTELRRTTIRFGALWYPVMSDVRRLDAFKELMTELNLVEYWRTYGWADACRPVGEEDFACM
jgi:tetratricopeptide (TPR) repeat protein